MGSNDEGSHWRGVPLSEMYGSQSPWGAPEFRLVVPGYNHAVLYHIPSGGRAVSDAPPKPRVGTDVWNHDYVRMPCSSQSLYPVEDRNGETHLKKRWDLIVEALSKPIRNSKELAETILSYNTKFRTIWTFTAMFKLFDEYLEEEESQYFFDVTLPEIAKLALALPKLVQAPIPLLSQNKNMSVSLSQQQVSSLLANAFFCTFPRRNTSKRMSEYGSYPYINFHILYNTKPLDRVMEKLKCVCHYFRRVTTKVPVGVVTYSRRCVAPDALPEWGSSDRPISTLPLHVDSKTTIEDADGLLQVDFANKFLGGGVLNTGSVQEEIRFMICPELMLSMLFTEILNPNEAVIIIGSERYSDYTGYGNTFAWRGAHHDTTPRDSSARRRCAVLAIDALPYRNVRHEYTPDLITRELNKAWIGFSFDSDEQCPGAQYPGVATGNWGCGAFRGSPQLKSLVQAMACAQARRPMAYYTFSDVELRDDIVNVYNLLARHNVTIGELYKYIMKFATMDVRIKKLHPYLYEVLNEPMSQEGAIVETPEEKIPPVVLKEFLSLSPDLFSQGESDHSVSEFKIFMEEQEAMDTSDNGEKIISTSKENTTTSTSKTEHTSRFFDEVQKLEEENGGNRPTNKRKEFHLDKSIETLDSEDKIQIDMTPDRRKKMGKKITDYFSKKSI